jgi:hypothetical protein
MTLIKIILAEALRKQLEENDRQMKAMQQSYEEKIAASKAMVTIYSILRPYLKKIIDFTFLS